jgi:hypothetical protein
MPVDMQSLPLKSDARSARNVRECAAVLREALATPGPRPESEATVDPNGPPLPPYRSRAFHRQRRSSTKRPRVSRSRNSSPICKHGMRTDWWITGSETDVCVLGTVLGAVDVGYRVIIVRDAICSSSDQGHDALMEVYHSRFSEQIETANAHEILDAWS